jgi:hypothetical protein
MLLVHTSGGSIDGSYAESAATVPRKRGGLGSTRDENDSQGGGIDAIDEDSHSESEDSAFSRNADDFSDSSDSADEDNGESGGAMNSLSSEFKKKKQFSNYVRSFIPARYGGDLEGTIVHINLPESSENIQESSETIEDIFAEKESTLQYFYKMVSSGTVISVDVLFLLASWPNVTSLTDEAISWLASVMDYAPKMHTESYKLVCSKQKESSLAYKDCQSYFEKSCILKAGLTALCSCLTLQPKEEGSQQNLPICFRIRNFDEWSKDLYHLGISRRLRSVKQSTLSSFRTKLLEGILSHVDGHMSEMHLLALHRAWIFEDAIMKKKIGYGDTALEHVHVEAQKLDKAYACMVHGSCMKVPLVPDIWCPHEGIESVIPIGKETDSFFKASFFCFFLMFFLKLGGSDRWLIAGNVENSGLHGCQVA